VQQVWSLFRSKL